MTVNEALEKCIAFLLDTQGTGSTGHDLALESQKALSDRRKYTAGFGKNPCAHINRE